MNTYPTIRPSLPQRRAIVLLIVLGMLSLFSILIVTYVVFSSQARQAAFGNSLRRDREVNHAPIHDSIIKQIVAGGGARSATFGQDLLGDLYGVDEVRTRVAHVRSGGGGGPGDIEYRAMLLRPTLASLPDTTLFKIPLHFAPWNRDGSDVLATQLTSEVVAPLTLEEFNSDPSPFQQTLDSHNLPDYRLNDAFTGRLVTFGEGPLQGNTFRIVRYFGIGALPPTGNAVERKLAGNIIIDLNEAKSQTIIFNGASWNLLSLAKQNPNALLYSFGADNAPGFAASATDLPGEYNSDDVGFSLTINGATFNGLGANASGENEITRANPADANQPFKIDAQFGPELLPNRRITGVIQQISQPDEMYDAADFENWMLAWQPSDHRAILPADAVTLANRTGMAIDDARKATPHVIPSFHRPEVINYLMHKPIWYDDNDDGVAQASELRTFANLTAGGTNDDIRLQILIRRLRAATYRPLNFGHLFVTSALNPGFAPNNPRQNLKSDLDGDGIGFDGNPDFNGSHPFPILNTAIEVNSASTFSTLHAQITQLSTWLINGPWDVDNDGDGLPDSIWVDFDLPAQVVGNGTVVRPMVAALIEDLDGRINLNAAGNYSHITSQRFQPNNPENGYTNLNEYFQMDSALQTFGRGGGLGPAEINFSHLFDEPRIGNPDPPFFFTQTSTPRNDVLRTRYGNILQSRYGGRPWNYQSALNGTFFPIAHPGMNVGSGLFPGFSDPFSRILLGARRNTHDFGVPMGRAIDMFGRSTIRKQRGGNAVFDMVAENVPAALPNPNNAVMTEIVNQPYEFEVDNPVGDDNPFTASEFHAIADQGTGRLLADRLVSLVGSAAESNEALSRLLTFDSRSLDSVELPGGLSVVDFMIARFPPAIRNDPARINTQMQRMLAVELRKGGKLNLNRPLGNGVNDLTDLTIGNVAPTVTDETLETRQYDVPSGASNPNRFAAEAAFPQLDNDNVSGNGSSPFEEQSRVPASYLPLDMSNVGQELERLTGAELLARNLYCLMYRLIVDPQVDLSISPPTVELFPNFPYPANLRRGASIRNHYVARRLAQWAVNVVDMRDTDAIMTRLRFDPFPFDTNGFELDVAQQYVVWGMERPEIALNETFATHDRRVSRELVTGPDPNDPTQPDSDEPSAIDGPKDGEMDQFRIPEASAFVELKSLRDPHFAPSMQSAGESYPAELYSFDNNDNPWLDLGRVVGVGNERSPVWRMAVGYTAGAHQRSTLWTQDARRLSSLNLDPELPAPFTLYSTNDDDEKLWEEVIAPAGDIIHPVGDNSKVYLYDDDLDQRTEPLTQAVTFDRFVWFANLAPNAGLNLVALSDESGMRIDNVFFPAAIEDLSNPNNPASAVPALLAPGGYAVVAPRTQTVFGRTAKSTEANNWGYYPSAQRFEFQRGGMPMGYSLKYFNIRNRRSSPDYPVDRADDYRVNHILPIIAECLPPQSVDTTGGAVATSWTNYFNATSSNRNDRVGQRGIGFNISAPLSGPNYYPAPTHRINNTPSTAAEDTYYPKIDGYRDYVNSEGLHPDFPFDELTDTQLKTIGIGVGSYQDVSSIFLQRLADPTLPWDPEHNPYITIDSMSMDLTVFNGDANLRTPIAGNGPGTETPMDVTRVRNRNDVIHTPLMYPTKLAFDTRRKIPDPLRDRPQSQVILDNIGDDPSAFTSYSRYVYAQRSSLMTRQSVLRNVTETSLGVPEEEPHFRHELISAWEAANNIVGTPSTASIAANNLHSGFRFEVNTATPPAIDINAKRFDTESHRYPQTLGFVNREFGEPAQAGTTFAGSRFVNDRGLYVGFPIAVNLQMPTWLDRPFQSIHELMSVPATSISRFAREYDSGTLLEAAGTPVVLHETPTRFGHLLGFEAGIGQHQAGDVVDTTSAPGSVEDGRTSAGFTRLTGRRAGFEQIFDFVDIGALSFGEKNWFDPVQIRRLPSPASDKDQMFNRATQLLQAPFNYNDRHRTTGKINLNTMPDYIRKGGEYQRTFTTDAQRQRPFTSGTDPRNLANAAGMSGIASAPNNNLAGTPADPFNTAVLYGNGSVYRSLAAGISTFYDLDDTPGERTTTGTYNGYNQTVDSRFGFGFKGFIHGRRGYGTSLVGPVGTSSDFLNSDLDYRYPTRFAGLFAPSAASTLPSVQLHMRSATSFADNATEMTLRRTHDMSLLRPHRDFDVRVMDDVDARTAATTTTTPDFALAVETPPTIGPPSFRNARYVNNSASIPDSTSTEPIERLMTKVVNVGLFERSQAELHKNHRLLDRDPFFRFQNPAHLSGMTTHHSNVFMVRYTVGFFVVDPITGAVGAEYFDPNEGYSRPRGFHIVDRTIPVGYEPITGTAPRRELNASDTIIYSYTK